MIIVPKAKKKVEKQEIQGCKVCEREKVSENYCKYHERAHQNVMEAYDDWQEGYGELSFEEYLKKLIENKATGVWAKQIAEELLEKENL
jgi:hypothetical protein